MTSDITKEPLPESSDERESVTVPANLITALLRATPGEGEGAPGDWAHYFSEAADAQRALRGLYLGHLDETITNLDSLIARRELAETLGE